MNALASKSFPLRTAYLCPECKLIGDNGESCDCGNRNLMYLAPILDRETENDETEKAYFAD